MFDSEDAAELNTIAHLKDVLWHITMPLFCLVYGGLAFLSRFSRSGMLGFRNTSSCFATWDPRRMN